jgi:AraC-like DNA-binding protein
MNNPLILMDISQVGRYDVSMIGLKNIIDNIDITVLNAEFYTAGKEWNYRNVSNTYSRIYYITEGYATVEHHDHVYEMQPGHIYLIPCYTTVNMYSVEGFSHYYVHFSSRLQTGLDILTMFECDYQRQVGAGLINRGLFDRLLELNPNKELVDYDANKPIYKQVLERAVVLDQDKSPSDIFETNAIIRLFLSAFFRDYSHPQFINTLHGLKRFEKVLGFIHEHLNSPMTIPQLAKIACLSPTYFSNLFSKLIGTSPLQYINKRRIEKAQELLLGTDRSLYEISQQIGIDDEYYFSRLFKKTVGISPDHYRKQERMINTRLD